MHTVCSLSGLDGGSSGVPPQPLVEPRLSDLKARDILEELTARATCGAALSLKVGRRGWTRPRVGVSPRLFKQYRVGDPWDPSSKDTQTPIGLGPVSLRLGEARRQPAPHLKPKTPKKPASAAPPPAPRVPEARPTPPPAASKAAPTPKVEDEDTARLAEVAAQKRRQAEAAMSWPRRRAPSPADRGSSGRGDPGHARAPLPVRPEAREEVASRVEQDVGQQRTERRDSGGRFRMKSSEGSRAPVVRDIHSEPEVDVDDSPAPRARAAPLGSVGGGLDDLFAAAAQQGRLRVPARPAESSEE
jgi:hypothetical protein